ncbi:hypothetical protein CVT25_002597 [Psilocybe cyanescens]|uniref:Uncharacterized protein n=1 Tax=Psilocybe cyanescens TaxID=93625 RepID=A0A409XR18_PSICY|nr:hypothetical protein CVT25_002597 [Psilocybe cyanescens]
MSIKYHSASPDRKVTGPKHHIYPNTSPPKRYYYGAPTPEMTPESSVASESLEVSQAKAPPPLDLPLELSLTRSQDSNHGSPIVSSSPSTESSTSSSEALSSTNQHPDLTSHSTRVPSHKTLRQLLVFGPGHALPFSIQEEEEVETSASSYSTSSKPRSTRQKKIFAASSLTVESQSRRSNVSEKPSKERSFKKRRSFRKRMRRIFGGGRDSFKGGDRIQF